MTAIQVIQAVLQLAALFPSLAPAFIQIIRDFEAMFAEGNEPTQADIDALIDRVKSQSAAIQALDTK